MRSTVAAFWLLILISASVNAISITEKGPGSAYPAALLPDEPRLNLDEYSTSDDLDIEEPPTTPNSKKIFEKRRGGGRGGGGGKSSGGSSSTGAGGSRSNAGGRTVTGSGSPRGYSGSYSGGAAVPFTSGKTSNSGLVPVSLSVAVLSVVFAGAWIYSSVYSYNYARLVNYFNSTSNRNETLPVSCLCQEYSVCGCDENHDQTYIDGLVADAMSGNLTVEGGTRSKIAELNNTRTLFINGTLENGTTADGGTEEISEAGMLGQSLGLALALAVFAGVFLN